MEVKEEIRNYIASQPEPKRSDLETLHQLILHLLPDGQLWYLDGTDETGKVVTNPSIGYGQVTRIYKDGSTKEFYQIGISANTAGISIYIMGLDDKTYLPATYASTIGKAKVTGYCIRFKSLQQIYLDVLETAIRDGIAQTGTQLLHGND